MNHPWASKKRSLEDPELPISKLPRLALDPPQVPLAAPFVQSTKISIIYEKQALGATIAASSTLKVESSIRSSHSNLAPADAETAALKKSRFLSELIGDVSPEFFNEDEEGVAAKVENGGGSGDGELELDDTVLFPAHDFKVPHRKSQPYLSPLKLVMDAEDEEAEQISEKADSSDLFFDQRFGHIPAPQPIEFDEELFAPSVQAVSVSSTPSKLPKRISRLSLSMGGAVGDEEPKPDQLLANSPLTLHPHVSPLHKAANLQSVDLTKNYHVGNLWGLPGIVNEIYVSRGIKKFYDWQIECLSSPELLAGKNLVYSLPTSGGKTLVAEISLMRTSVLNNKKALFVLPYVAIVNEKVNQLEEFGRRLSFRVDGYHGSEGLVPPPPGNQVMIATIEKANSVVNSLIAESRLEEIGLVVVDELRALSSSRLSVLCWRSYAFCNLDMIAEEGRGGLLELLLTKILYVSNRKIQIVGMSATLPNLSDIAAWLDAIPFEKHFRPVDLVEYLKIGDFLYTKEGQILRQYSSKDKKDPDHIAELVREIVPSASMLIFCPSKKSCQSTAEMLAVSLDPSLADHRKEERHLVLEKLRASSTAGRVDEALAKAVPYGIAYHHSGLTTEERVIIEEAYREKILCVICCTSTLAAGVNLPARRVLIRSFKMGIRPISSREYRQMAGRAGRAGIDDHGESILIANQKDKEEAMTLFHATMDCVVSSLIRFFTPSPATKKKPMPTLGPASELLKPAIPAPPPPTDSVSTKAANERKPAAEEGEGEASEEAPHFSVLTRIVIEALQGNYAWSVSSMMDFFSYAYVAISLPVEAIEASLKASFSYLLTNRFIILVPPEENPTDDIRYRLTSLGEATALSSFSPEEAYLVCEELQLARRQGLILEDDLHLCYLVTPMFNLPDTIDWNHFFNLFIQLPEIQQTIAFRCGFSPAYLQKRAHGGSGAIATKSREEHRRLQRSATRFFVALAMSELIKEVPIWDVSRKFKIPRGDLEQLMKAASAFAHMTVSFAKRLEWTTLAAALSDYVKRLQFGTKIDVLPLVEIKGVGAVRARLLYKAGFRTVRAIAMSNPDDLIRAVPRLGQFGNRAAVLIVQNAKRLLEQQALDLRKEAQEILSVLSVDPNEPFQ